MTLIPINTDAQSNEIAERLKVPCQSCGHTRGEHDDGIQGCRGALDCSACGPAVDAQTIRDREAELLDGKTKGAGR